MSTLLETRKLCGRHGGREVVSDITFSLRSGEVLGFLGLNGAGKSTTMNLVSGVLAPSAGSVLLAGHDLIQEPLMARRQLGYLPEHPPLYPDVRVREYLEFCARLRGLRGRELRRACLRASQQCGLEQSQKKLIRHLSKGYRQRLGIAQAIVHRPRVLVLDEPTSGLDPSQIQEVRRLVNELRQECAILLSSHILSEVEELCDRALILHQGRLVQEVALSAPTHHSLYIRLAQPIGKEKLLSLPQVTAAEIEGDGFRIVLNNPQQRSQLAAELTRWGLLSLQDEQRPLERLFARVTRSEASEAKGVPC